MHSSKLRKDASIFDLQSNAIHVVPATDFSLLHVQVLSMSSLRVFSPGVGNLWPTAREQFLCGPPALQKKNQRGTPIFLTQILHPWPHFSLQSTSKDPIFHLESKISQFFTRISIFFQFPAQNGNFHSNLTQLTPNNPYFEKFTPRKIQAFWIMTDDPFVSKKSYTKRPYICSPVGTPSLSYSSPPKK